jgi:membrane associated rhomboid family serine protease
MGLLPGFRVDNAAHLGGLAGGFAVAYIAGSLPLRDFNDKLWNLLAAIAGLLTAYAFLQMFLRFQEYTR